MHQNTLKQKSNTKLLNKLAIRLTFNQSFKSNLLIRNQTELTKY